MNKIEVSIITAISKLPSMKTACFKFDHNAITVLCRYALIGIMHSNVRHKKEKIRGKLDEFSV